MDLPEFGEHVRTALAQARDSLARIEMEVRESGERPALMEASRILAQFCMHGRDYLSTAPGRPLPRRFATRVAVLREALERVELGLVGFELHPSAGELGVIVQAALDLGERA